MGILDSFRRKPTTNPGSGQPLPPPQATQRIGYQLPATWPETPTLRLGRTIEAVGESYYPSAYPAALDGAATPHSLVAVLLPEPHNEHDAQAVAIILAGHKAGHLSRDDARAFRPQIDDAITTYGCAAVPARIVGGDGRWGVYLDPADGALPYGRQAIEAALYAAGFVNYDEDQAGFGIYHDPDGGFSVWNGGDDPDEAAEQAKVLRAAGFQARVQARQGGGKKVKVSAQR